VAATSEQILDAGSEISKGARYGRDEVQSTFAAVEGMAASMTKVSSNAAESAAAAQAVLRHAGEGNRSMDESYAGMRKIDDAVAETAERMRHLEERGQEVFAIIRLIKDLATRSNLLSLNAAIEAAHAGDAGWGFAIVADEVRRLADRSSEATANVTGIVERIVEDTRAALEALHNAMGEVTAGRDISELARSSLETIGSLAQESARLAAAISDASRDQARVTTAVSHTMRTIANVTELSAASAEEATAAVRRLVSLADRLNQTISKFKLQ
jgi:twitching motility protein PilJ